jgi:hypothetical protein
MARQTWMDRMIETARTAEVHLPWSRTAPPPPAQPVRAQG